MFVLVSCSAISALDLSLGGGVYFADSYNAQKYEDILGRDNVISTNSPVLGFDLFFDATYFMVDLGFGFELSGKEDDWDRDGSDLVDPDIDNDRGWINIGVLGKIPFKITPEFRLFPLVGIEYRLCVYYMDGDTDLKPALTYDQLRYIENEFWFNFGVGADFDISSSVYIRPNILLGFKFRSKYEEDRLDFLQITDSNAKWNHFKLEIGVSIGFDLK